MLIDFPDYSHGNPWQIKTIQTSAPMEVLVTNKLEVKDCFALHISWEDALLRGYDTPEKAEFIITHFEEYLRAQSLRSKIIWTVHNLTSHSYALKDAEKKLRSVIMEYASLIVLMSTKHAFIVPEKYQSKIVVIPHYIEENPFPGVPKNTMPTFFKYGADRGRKDNDFYLKILNSPKVRKFVSDSRLNIEIDTIETVVTKRRFTFTEADIYARLSNFTTFYQEPKFNSGVMNFCIGSGLAVFHDKESVRYMDLPTSFDKFCLDLSIINELDIAELQSLISINKNDIKDFLAQRTPKEVSNAFWKHLFS